MSDAKKRRGAPPEEQLDLSGQMIAGYRVLRKLGQGGMGQVYLAQQLALERNVALKILRPDLASDPTALKRFEEEAKAVARATHANIVQVYEFGVADGLAFMALEYVEGRNLKEYLARKGPPDVIVAVSIMRQVASALQRASELGLIHRDIKPENILLTRKGEAKVADFGLVRAMEGDRPVLNLTQTGVTMGTPLYMSPEQVEGKPVDPRTDIYSFGVTCYHMLAGHPPFSGESAFEVALQHVQKKPVPLAQVRPDLPEALCAIVHKMMAKDPAERHQTGKELLRDIVRLREVLSGVSTTLAPAGVSLDQPTVNTTSPALPAPTAALAAPNRRRGVLAALVVLSVVAALCGGAAIAWTQRGELLPHGQDVGVADASAKEALGSLSKQEQTLRDAVELSLNGKVADKAGGFGNCMDLGLFYLDNDRLDDADKHFARLEAIKEPPSYRMLGHVGKGIVLALKDHPKESNAEFSKVFVGQGKGGLGKEKAKEMDKALLLKRIDNAAPQIAGLLHNQGWSAWIARARWYNSKNGLHEKEVPVWMARLYPVRDGIFEPPPRPADREKGPRDRQAKDKIATPVRDRLL